MPSITHEIAGLFRAPPDPLADCGPSLRNIVTAQLAHPEDSFTFPATGDDNMIGRDDLLRWADALEAETAYRRIPDALMIVGLAVWLLIGMLLGAAWQALG